MSSVVVVGSCNLDLIVEVDTLPSPGQTILGGDVTIRPGGKGANQAVAARRLGADAAFVGAIGTDEFALTLRAALTAEALDLTLLTTVDGPSGVALILVDSDAENVVAVAPGANRRFTPSHLGGLRALLAPSAVVLLQMEIPVETNVAAATIAHACGARVILNAAPVMAREDPEFEKLLGLTDVLVLNETEALTLCGHAPPTRPEEWLAVAAEIAKSGPPVAVVTLGPRGAVVFAANQAFAVQPYNVSAVDSTGAGDAFCGGLATAMAAGRPVVDAVRYGCAAGALATTAVGAQAALPKAEQVDQLEALEEGSAYA